MSQPFHSLDELVRELRVLLPAPRDTWRLVKDPVVGEILGVPNFRGTTLATNGILVLLRNEVGRVMFGHLEWFQPDESEANVELSDLWEVSASHRPASRKPTKLEKTLADYMSY